ncbi:MAG: hypothetical protein WBF47_18400 [Xanthobacteraceae bacterium]|jgi:hypothetical protein
MHTASEAKMRIALILVPALFAALSLTLAFQSPTKPTNRRTQETQIAWSRFTTAITNLDLQAVVAFCLIGFLLTLNLILRFPDIGAIAAQYSQF